ncbi:MAG: DeoR family transcriptional regulator, fructose operon transcriptional repressor [Clostridiales bacterium]|jgi:DeoR family fructose operon transcriptional repressor|nr:DeoR family transcriptional regulator, fructose operon transcriptional repressor [Clostridiales bacterium]
MLPGERRLLIVELLKANQSISVKQLCDQLNASEATIRRDLSLLEEQGKIVRTHGGALIGDPVTLEDEASVKQKENLHLFEKKAIAKKAFEQIRPHDSLMIDAGTTTIELAKLIGKSDLSLTVITNATMIANALSDNPKVTVYLVGGKLRNQTLATVGSAAIRFVESFNVHHAFIGVNGITPENGFTTPDLEEALIKKAMLQSAKTRYILADHTKFNKINVCQIAQIAMADFIISDSGLDTAISARFEENDIEILFA